MMRSASRVIGVISTKGNPGGLPACDTAENAANRHTEAREIASPKNVAGHDFSTREQIADRAAVSELYAGAIVDLDAQVGKGDPGAKRPGEKGGRIELLRPLGFW